MERSEIMTNFINKIKTKLGELIADRTGATFTEYALLLGFVALAAVVAVQSAGAGTKSALDNVSVKLADAAADSSAPDGSPSDSPSDSPGGSPSDDGGGDDEGDDDGKDKGKDKDKDKDKGKGKK
jgi:eukaryotic-like serine/threonine-protein kinase